MAVATARRGKRARRIAERFRPVARAFAEHDLVTHASAIAFRVLIALVPLTLLGLGLLGALGLEDVWSDSIAPAIQERVTAPVFTAIDFSVDKIFASSTAGLIAFAALLLLWDLTWAVRAVMRALNEVHGVEDGRSFRRRVGVAVALALVTGLALVASILAVIVLPRLASDGVVQALVTVVAWLVAASLLGLVVGLLVRYAPAEQPSASWASAGSLLIVGAWIAASLLFGWWAGSVANYKTATGTLAMFLALTAYVLVSSAVLLVGVEVDELARKESEEPG